MPYIWNNGMVEDWRVENAQRAHSPAQRAGLSERITIENSLHLEDSPWLAAGSFNFEGIITSDPIVFNQEKTKPIIPVFHRSNYGAKRSYVHNLSFSL